MLRGLKVKDSRSRAITRIGRFLVRRGIPRVQMTIMVAATGLTGFLFSAWLLHLQVHSMWIRYPLAVIFAYTIFLLILRLWLYYWHRKLEDHDISDPGVDITGDVFSLPMNISSSGQTDTSLMGSFAGGESGGGGTEASFGEGNPSSGGISDSLDMNLGFDLDCDELIVIVVVAAAVFAFILSAVYIVFIAPTFLAEILLDGVLISALYGRLKNIERRYWLESALRHTWIPVAIVFFVFLITGWVFQAYAPEAKSIGGVWEHLQKSGLSG